MHIYKKDSAFTDVVDLDLNSSVYGVPLTIYNKKANTILPLFLFERRRRTKTLVSNLNMLKIRISPYFTSGSSAAFALSIQGDKYNERKDRPYSVIEQSKNKYWNKIGTRESDNDTDRVAILQKPYNNPPLSV